MSIPVDLDALADAIAERGPVAYFLTGGPDGRPHATHATVEVDGGVLRVGAGRKTARNASERPAVSFLWPPAEEGGYSMIVDGDAVIEGDDGERVAVVTPTFAVLHRPADHAPAEPAADGACEADCTPIGD